MSEPTANISEPPDGSDPNDVENAWTAEIERRRRELQGRVDLVSGEHVRRKLRVWKPRER
ncbi:MAG: hypothetical protein AB8I08_32950 [Sandaracinaceae bacterium]